MRNEFPVEIVDVIDQPGLDEIRKSARDIEVLGTLPELLELFRQQAMLHQMGVGSGKGQEPHQAFFHGEMNPGLDGQFLEDGIRGVAVSLVGRTPESLEEVLQLAMLQVDLGNADIEFTETLIGALDVHNRVATLEMIGNANTMGNENFKRRAIRKPRRGFQSGRSGIAWECLKRLRYSRGPLPVQPAKAR